MYGLRAQSLKKTLLGVSRKLTVKSRQNPVVYGRGTRSDEIL